MERRTELRWFRGIVFAIAVIPVVIGPAGGLGGLEGMATVAFPLLLAWHARLLRPARCVSCD